MLPARGCAEGGGANGGGLEERSAAGHVTNQAEVAICIQILSAYVAAGVAPSRLAVLSPYRAQLRLLGARRPPSCRDVELLTIDQSQGRDFDAVLISFVRSNPKHETGNLLADFRRLNVAFSRAKAKLVLVGAPQTLCASPALRSLLRLAAESHAEEGWWVRLPPRAEELYDV